MRSPPFKPLPISGLDISTLTAIAKDLQIVQVLSQREVRTITVDYILGVAEQACFRPEDAEDVPCINSVMIEPIPITYTIEDAMFGGDIYVVLSADGRALCRPILWDGYENFGRYVLGVLK